MMGIMSSLVMLLSMCGALTQSMKTEGLTHSQTIEAAAAFSTQPDVSAELKELRDTVAKLSLALQSTQDELKVMEADNIAVKERLVSSETQIYELKSENAAQRADVTAMQSRLLATETDVDVLQMHVQAASKVAFTAALPLGHVHSGDRHLNLVFSKVLTNVGEAYSSKSGVFTAPVRGVYYFRFTVVDLVYNSGMTVQLSKNGQVIMQLFENETDGNETYLSSGMTLELELGDEVNMVLPPGYKLFDSGSNHSTFSGFLLFPL
ncbi:cerebellin-1-like [Engraulis encrasicolus]|uniref:cerebellin-1-like n=1 Tax=Engraulis encrasicolus TaxID=184585 RepID=UPI002FD51E65